MSLDGQRHENVERKWTYNHIIIFPEWISGMMVLPELKLCSGVKLVPPSDKDCFKMITSMEINFNIGTWNVCKNITSRRTLKSDIGDR